MGLETAALAMMAVSGATQAFGSYYSGRSQQKAEEMNAGVSRLQAENVERAKKLEAYKIRKEARLMESRQRALYGKAGVLSNSGSPLATINDTAAEYEMDEMISNYNYTVEKSKALSQASYYDFLGKTAYNEGIFGASTSVLSTAANMSFLKSYNAKKK